MKLYKSLISVSFLILLLNVQAQVEPKNEWWLKEPFRLIQTNLREIDAIDFDIDVFISSLTEIGANTVLINVGGIVANYYTDLDFHYQNPHLKFDMIQEVIDKLHMEGIRVIGRFDFSKLNEEYADKNPQWLYKSVKGETVNYNQQVHTCINGGYQQKYSLKILNEALSRFPLDGVFFNMIGYQTRDYSHNYHGICQCESCKKRFKEWSEGLDLPTKEDRQDAVFRKYLSFKSYTSEELFYRIQDLIKSFGKHIAISTYTYAGTDFYRRESNSHSALYSNYVPFEYSASHNVKSVFGSWKNKQVSNAAVHFYGYPARHSADANWLTQKRLVQNMINGAGLDFYCIGRLDNLEDRTVLENVRNVFQFHKAHEKFLHHTTSDNRVLLLHDSQSGNEYKGIFEILTENHIQFDVMEHWCIDSEDVPREIERYEMIILPGISRLSDKQVKQLDKFVEKGGKILATGFPSTKDEIGNPLGKVRLNCLGIHPEYDEFEKVQGTYYRILQKDKKIFGDPVFNRLDIVYCWEQGMHCQLKESARGMMGYIPPAMIGPPEKTYYTKVTEIPGLISNKYGDGKTAFLTFNVGALYHHKRHYGHAALVTSALKSILNFEPHMKTDASPLVEIACQKSIDGSWEWFGMLNHTGQLGNGFNHFVPIYNTKFKFKSQKKINAIKSLITGEEIPFNSGHNWTEVTLPVLNSFDIVLVEYEVMTIDNLTHKN